MPRFFTRDQAQALLPEVERLLREAMALKRDFEANDKQLRTKTREIQMAGGTRVKHGVFLELRARRDGSVASLQETVNRIHDTGCQVKDLDMGLVDFPTNFRGTEVCLCWKLGETAIDWWHGTEEGFGGRKPIDAEFLANHGCR